MRETYKLQEVQSGARNYTVILLPTQPTHTHALSIVIPQLLLLPVVIYQVVTFIGILDLQSI